MFTLVGLIVVFVAVFGGYFLAGGKFEIILKALPYEFMMIGGAALGAFIISNSVSGVKKVPKEVLYAFKGETWHKSHYLAVLCLANDLLKLMKSNPASLEAQIDDPSNSEVFKRYTDEINEDELIEVICDIIRLTQMNFVDSSQLDDLLEVRLEGISHKKMALAHALQAVADALPALGIVAAVLGVIKTMASIDQPPEVLGGLIGGALVGTFLGIFLSYGIVGPIAAKMDYQSRKDLSIYGVTKEIFVCCLQGHSVNICLEIGRQSIPDGKRPSFEEVEKKISELRLKA